MMPFVNGHVNHGSGEEIVMRKIIISVLVAACFVLSGSI
jgi:hypothetical protein